MRYFQAKIIFLFLLIHYIIHSIMIQCINLEFCNTPNVAWSHMLFCSVLTVARNVAIEFLDIWYLNLYQNHVTLQFYAAFDFLHLPGF